MRQVSNGIQFKFTIIIIKKKSQRQDENENIKRKNRGIQIKSLYEWQFKMEFNIGEKI